MSVAWMQFQTVLLNLGNGVLVYLVLVALAHLLKRGLRVPFGFGFHVFALWSGLLMSWFVYRLQRASAAEPAWIEGAWRLALGVWAVLLALQANQLLNRLVWQFALEERRRVQVPRLLRDLAKLVLVLVAVLCVAKFVYGRSLSTLLTASGLVAIVLGFALQNLLGDVVAGIALNLEKPFAVGDWVTVAGIDGEVIEINWRATRLRTRADNYLIIPNGAITKESLTNYHYPTRLQAQRATVGVDYGTPPNDVKAVLRVAVQRTPGVVASREPRVRLKQFGESSITYEVKFWIDDAAAADDLHSDVMTNLWYALRRARMRIPFPIRDVFLHETAGTESAEHRQGTEAERALGGIELFKPLDDVQRAALAAQARIVRFGRGETVLSQGEAGASLFHLLSGSASVLLGREAGSEAVVGRLEPGETFGEMSLLTGAPRGATIVAESDLRLLEIGKDALSAVLQANPKVAEALSRLAAERQLATEGFFQQQQPIAEAAATRARYAGRILRGMREFFDL